MKKPQPLSDRIVVQTIKEHRVSGIEIPDSAKKETQTAKVISVGQGKNGHPIEIKEGNTVFFGRNAGTEITLDGQSYTILRESDIYAFLE